MSKHEKPAPKTAVYAYVAGYPNEKDARVGARTVHELHADGVVQRYDIALVYRDERGNVHVRKRERRTSRSTWVGIGVGAVVGALLPPAVPVAATVSGTKNHLVSALRHGMPRADLQTFADVLQAGEAALVVLGEAPLAPVLDPALTGCSTSVERRIAATTTTLVGQLGALEDA